MPDDVLKLFSHDGPWVLFCAAILFLYFRSTERAACQMVAVVERNNAASKEASLANIEAAKAIAEMCATIDSIPERLRAVILEMQRK
jgi:hypothetical protein